jgi:hypothetical protein
MGFIGPPLSSLRVWCWDNNIPILVQVCLLNSTGASTPLHLLQEVDDWRDDSVKLGPKHSVVQCQIADIGTSYTIPAVPSLGS